jgi:hypothetical protein
VEALRAACDEVLGGALGHYEQVIGGTVPEKMPMPLQVHRRAGEDCSRCGARIEAIHIKDYVMCCCPEEQTAGQVLKGPAPLQAAEVASVAIGPARVTGTTIVQKILRAQMAVPMTVVSFSLWLSRSCCAFGDQGRQ